MPRWRRLSPLAVLLALLASGAACSGAAAPDEWARDVCVALTPWRAKITELTTRAQGQMTQARTPAETKANLVSLFAGAEDASETAHRRVADAGVPDVEFGDSIAEHFLGSLERARDAYGHAKAAVDALDVGAAQPFYDGVAAAFETLNEEYAASALDTTKVGSADLQRAFDEVPECR